MKLAIIYDPTFPKLTAQAYSQTYRDMFLALIDRYEEVQEITESCSAQDIEADHIIFFDIHSCHDITIDGVAQHKAVKFEYFNDPYQEPERRTYHNGVTVVKMGPKERSIRANERGVKYVISPQSNMFYKHIAPHFDGKLLWFPPAPMPRVKRVSLLAERKAEVLASGHLWQGHPGFRPYAFRRWAALRDDVTLVKHSLDNGAPCGDEYQKFLSGYAACLALCDTQMIPKYLEIPMAGCLCLAQDQYDYAVMGMADYHSCVLVNRANFADIVEDVKRKPSDYQTIANNGMNLILNNWTAKHFAEKVHNAN
ncbi:MAG: glycosyltransferase family 1 protein [Chloroflexi bacterium]|nr:glycosyltransferase family 1 protein [Chloroflexota bacterium]